MIAPPLNVGSMFPALGYAAGGALAFITYAGYASMAPRSQFFGPTFTHGGDRRKLALTYDDGPNDPHTLHLLDVLAENQVKATFFLIGRYVVERPDIVRRLAAEGHAIGNHTYSHPNLIFCSTSTVEREIADCDKAISDAIGRHSNLFRPPFGGRRPAVLRTVRHRGLIPIMWSVSSRDWTASAGAESIERRVVRGVTRQPGNVILLHDGGHQIFGTDRRKTVEASREIIRACKGEGYEFDTVPDMLKAETEKAASEKPSRT